MFEKNSPFAHLQSLQENKKKARSTNRLQIRSGKTLALIEADFILLDFQQIPSNSNSAYFNKNIVRTSKLLKPLSTTISLFDGNSKKFEVFDNLFQRNMMTHKQPTEADIFKNFNYLMRGDALQIFKNISNPTRKTLVEILSLFRKKHIKLQSNATEEHKDQKFVFNPSNRKLVDFLDEL